MITSNNTWISNKTWIPLCLLLWVLSLISVMRVSYKYLAIGLIVVGLYSVVKRNEYRSHNLPWLLFALLGLHTILFSRFPSFSLPFYVNFLVAFLFYLTVTELLKKQLCYARTLWITYCTIFVPVAILMVLQFMDNPVRTKSHFFNEWNQNAMALLVCLLFIYAVMRSKLATFALTLVCSIAIFATDSRSTISLLMLSFICITIFEYKNGTRLLRLGCAVVACIVSYLFVLYYPSMISFNSDESFFRGTLHGIETLNSRTIFWSAAFNDILQHPWVGNGIGNFRRMSIATLVPDGNFDSPHNDYLRVWLGYGIFWALLFISFLTYTVVKYNPITKVKYENIEDFIAWLIIFNFCAYMGINFLISKILFLLIFSMLIAQIQTSKN